MGALALALAAGTALAAAPQRPQLAVVKLSQEPARLALLLVDQKGGSPVRLAGGGLDARPLVEFYRPISWSPDGERLAFTGILWFKRGDDHEPVRRLFTVAADGGRPRAIPGTKGAGGPIFAPDGRSVAFTRAVDRETPTRVGGKLWKRGFHGSSVWIVDLGTGAQRQLTQWRDRVFYTASSYSPDGSTLLATHEDPLLDEPEPVVLAVDGSGSRRLFSDGINPVYSPDGSEIALIRRVLPNGRLGMDLFAIKADGTGLRRLTRTPDLFESAVSWDPSGERLAFTRIDPLQLETGNPGRRDALMQINADGSCQTKIIATPDSIFYVPAWRPGPGREAGRIEC